VPAKEPVPAKAQAQAQAQAQAGKPSAPAVLEKGALGTKKPGEGRAPSKMKQKSPAPPGPKPREVVTAEAPAAKGSAPSAGKLAPVAPTPKPAAKPAPAEKVVKVAALPAPVVAAPPRPRGTWAPPGTRHPAGLAIDVGLLHKRDGTWLSVESHFHGHIGAKTCGEGAVLPEEARARELRELVCESQSGGIFTYVLTPNYNAAHADHYHMEIKPGVHWFLYH
jgi:hypothetical protein